MPLNESKLYETNGTRDEALQRPDRRPIPKEASTSAVEESPAPIAPVAAVEATQAEASASQTLELAMQSKVEGLHQAAERGASQATEEVLTEFTAYANVLLEGTEASTAAKAALRAGLNQSATPAAAARDFSSFFKLNAPAKRVSGGKN